MWKSYFSTKLTGLGNSTCRSIFLPSEPKVSLPGPPSHIFMTGGGGLKDFLGSDISAKRDFLGSMKDAEIFLGRENNTGIFLGIVFFISSNQQ